MEGFILVMIALIPLAFLGIIGLAFVYGFFREVVFREVGERQQQTWAYASAHELPLRQAGTADDPAANTLEPTVSK